MDKRTVRNSHGEVRTGRFARDPTIMELGFLTPLYSAAGPIVSVFLDTTRTSETAAKEIDLRWRTLRERLSDDGASPATLEALDGVVGTDTTVPGPQGQALFAAGGEVLAAHTMFRPPVRDHGSVLPVADPLDLLVSLDDTFPHVVVAADRTGADVHAYGPFGETADTRSSTGETLHINKVPTGGWRHNRFQRHTEEVWTRNAEMVAADVETAVAEVSASVVLVGGDERALGKLREHLSQRTRDLLVALPTGGRADYAAEESLRGNADAALRELAGAMRAEAIREFTGELRRGGAAAQGIAETAEALRKGQVARLLMAPERRGDPELWSGRDPMELATSRDRLADPEGGFSAPASALLLRAAHATGAEFSTLDDRGDAMEGVGALLRFELTE